MVELLLMTRVYNVASNGRHLLDPTAVGRSILWSIPERWYTLDELTNGANLCILKSENLTPVWTNGIARCRCVWILKLERWWWVATISAFSYPNIQCSRNHLNGPWLHNNEQREKPRQPEPRLNTPRFPSNGLSSASSCLAGGPTCI